MLTIKRNAAVRLGLTASLWTVAAAVSVPNLIPNVAHVELREQIRRATVIVIGIVESENVVRTITVGPKEDSTPLELRAVRIQVEGLLEGQVNDKRLTFYYYQVTGAWDSSAPNIVTVGERGIFYLVKDGEVLRATTDAYLSHTPLATGRHNISPATNKDQVHESIARLLLLPGEGANLQQYTASLHRNKAIAMDLVGKTQVVQILQSLLANPKPEIRGRACITMAEFPLKEKGCLPDVLHDVQSRPEDRKRAEELMRQN